MTAATSTVPPAGSRTRPARTIIWEEPTAFQRAVSMALVLIALVILVFLVNLVALSPLEHSTSQTALYQQVRLTLAEGATPVSPVGAHGAVVPLGTPLGVMYAPGVGIAKETFVEGTSSGQTMEAIGHRRDTGLPCQVGTSVLMARAGAFGGVGSSWAKLKTGQQFSMQTGQGSCTYEVIDQRHVGQKAPPAPSGREGALTLITASGLPYMPTEVLRVDAKLVTKAFNRPAIAFPTGSLPASEEAMGSDTSNLFASVLLLELLLAAVLAATWAWRRFGAMKTWPIAVPVVGTVTLLTANSFVYLLPNLL